MDNSQYIIVMLYDLLGLDGLSNADFYRSIRDIFKYHEEMIMPLILGKSRPLVPRNVKVIKVTSDPQKTAISVAKQIAKDFGQISKKMKPKKFILR